ncbi:MAG: DEAD/DEAH box helicase [Phycisphaeraceae bacterium]|nr:DEAD/DEAH box helicase [Phycisphaeraceae bacterium]
MSVLSGLLDLDGPIARRLGEGYERRPEQAAMVDAVERTIREKGTLLVEAGTGVGKSFAYLIPAIRRASETREKIVIATNTIALQEQLLDKDIPLLRAAMPDEFSAVLVKGRGNYLSIRRLTLASKRQERLLADGPSRASLHTIEDWAYQTQDGSLATLPQLDRPAVWDHVRSDSGNCMGRRCPNYDRCFFQGARRRMEHGDLLICNHALFFSDLALRARGVGFLPHYDHVILDEAHGVEDVATEHFGVSLAESRVLRLLGQLHHERTGAGFLANLAVEDDAQETLAGAVRGVLVAMDAARKFFGDLADYAAQRGGIAQSVRVGEPDVAENPVTEVFTALGVALKRLGSRVIREEDRYELSGYAERAVAIAAEAQALTEQQVPGCVYWIELQRRERSRGGATVSVTFACSPVEVGDLLREKLFHSEKSIILTSATMTTGSGAGDDAGAFRHLAQRLGIDLEGEGVETLTLGSPFRYAEQATLYVDPTMPDPRSARYTDELAQRVLRHILATRGGAFVLCTSYSVMQAIVSRTRDDLRRSGITTLVQGQDGARSALLSRFREDGHAALFGTASFWQGVDVKGEALRNVIITRLPFEPPDKPITEARHELLQSRGQDPFRDDSLPRAIIRFRQGFGRLIRSAADEGRVVVLDSRITTKGYGKSFLRAIPEGTPVVVEGTREIPEAP